MAEVPLNAHETLKLAQLQDNPDFKSDCAKLVEELDGISDRAVRGMLAGVMLSMADRDFDTARYYLSKMVAMSRRGIKASQGVA